MATTDAGVSGTQETAGPRYGDTAYWEERYSKDTSALEWHARFEDLSDLLRQSFPSKSQGALRLLDVGCGTSALAERLLECNAATEATCIDCSPSVISKATADQQSDSPERRAKYVEMDARDMSAFEEGSFDVVLDKGTLDSVLCGPDSTAHAKVYVQNAFRVLRSGGVLIVVSWRPPESRDKFLANAALPEGAGWIKTDVKAIEKPNLSTSLLPDPNAVREKLFIYTLIKK